MYMVQLLVERRLFPLDMNTPQYIELKNFQFFDIYCAVIRRHSFALRVISDVLWSTCFENYGPKDPR